MTLRTSRSPVIALFATAAIIFAACGGAASAPPSSSPTDAPSVAPTDAAPYEGTAYPATGEAPCGVAPYTGNFKKVSAVDRLTVKFELCAPDVAFLSKVAFSAFGIQDSDYLTAHMADKSILDKANGTGPYQLVTWDKGNRLVLKAFDGYWGSKAMTPNLEFRWSDQGAQRWVELQSGTVDGIDNPSTDDIAAIKADSSVTVYPREGLNTLYIGMNKTIAPWTDVRVRQAIAMGINRQQLVDNYYPAGSSVATHFTPCAIPFGCEGEPTWDFNASAAKQLLVDAKFDFTKTYKIQFRAAVRGYNPDPPVVATEIANQLKANLGINVALDLQESGTLLDANTAGTLEGLILLGWGADYPDATNFLDYHFGSGAGPRFGGSWDDIVAALNKGGQSADDTVRKAAYAEANNLIKEHVPAVIVAHGGSATVFKADVTGAHASPLSNEVFSVMKAGSRDTLVWMQNAEPLSLYCGDESDGESLRACEQINESLYGYTVGSTGTEPVLATGCTASADLMTWTCALRDGVKFHDGADLDANDVVLSYAVQWDAKHPLHIGRSGAFEYFPGLFGGFLNPPAS